MWSYVFNNLIPWCSDSIIIDKKKNKIIADLTVSYKLFNETFRSFVNFNKKNLNININYTEGPLKSLQTNWQFKKINNNKTEVIFDIDIIFKFWFFNKLLKNFYNLIEDKMIEAFEKRAFDLLSKNS